MWDQGGLQGRVHIYRAKAVEGIAGTYRRLYHICRRSVCQTRLSCHKFVANQVRLWLFVPAYNLGNFMRRLALLEDMKH